jgi:cytochrome c oxidase subunit 4
MALGSMRELFRKSDLMLMGVCVVLAAGFLVLAATSAALSGGILTIDNIFFTGACLLMALVFVFVPAMTLRQRGLLKNPFAIEEGVPAARAAEEVHFEGSTMLFFLVLMFLLFFTLVEVVLAYVQIEDLRVMLTILMGLSIIKAAAIMAYFMHLKFERMSLVLTLVPALVICICLLLIVFPDSFRAGGLRPKAAATSGAPAAGENAH